jgi:hypothetical protein
MMITIFNLLVEMILNSGMGYAWMILLMVHPLLEVIVLCISCKLRWAILVLFRESGFKLGLRTSNR